jgi:hypothetical protein
MFPVLDEEILTGNLFSGLSRQRQSELIENHCGDIKERIKRSASPEEAEGIAASVCEEFGKKCSSRLVIDAVALYIDDVLKEFKKDYLHARTEVQRGNKPTAVSSAHWTP